MDGIFTHSLTHSLARSLAHSLDPSLKCKLCDVILCYEYVRNKNNVNPAITKNDDEFKQQ